MRQAFLIVCIISVLLTSQKVSSQVYVSPTSNCTSNCSGSLSSPFSNIQQALNVSTSIILMNGTFKGVNNTNLTLQSNQFAISSVSGSNATIIDCERENFGMILYSGSFSLQGITFQNCIQNGNEANLTNWYDNPQLNFGPNSGGAILAASATTSFLDINFFNNSVVGYGGAVFLISASFSFNKCNFINNFANSIGGAFYVCSADVTIVGSEILSNMAIQNGGGIFVNNSQASIFTSQFNQNLISINNNTIEFSSNIAGSQIGCVSANISLDNNTVLDSNLRCDNCSTSSYNSKVNNTSDECLLGATKVSIYSVGVLFVWIILINLV